MRGVFIGMSFRYGHSMVGKMIAAQMTWPSHWILLIGAFTSTFGAALQSLCSSVTLARY